MSTVFSLQGGIALSILLLILVGVFGPEKYSRRARAMFRDLLDAIKNKDDVL